MGILVCGGGDVPPLVEDSDINTSSDLSGKGA